MSEKFMTNKIMASVLLLILAMNSKPILIILPSWRGDVLVNVKVLSVSISVISWVILRLKISPSQSQIK